MQLRDKHGLMGVNHAHLNNPSAFRQGRKMFSVHKNMQSFGQPTLNSSYDQIEQPQNFSDSQPYQQVPPYQRQYGQTPKDSYEQYFQKQQQYGAPTPKLQEQQYYPNDYQNYQEQPRPEIQQDYPPQNRSYEQEYPQQSRMYEDYQKYEPQREDPTQEELRRLRQQLQQKDEDLRKLQIQQPLPGDNQQPTQYNDIYKRYNKQLYDQVKNTEVKRNTRDYLNYQMTEKQTRQEMEKIEKERQQAKRIEELRKMREDEIRKREEAKRQAQEYQESLQAQILLKKEIQHHDVYDRRLNPTTNTQENLPSTLSSQPALRQPQQGFEKDTYDFYSSPSRSTPQTVMYTKKAPKTMTFDPITGVLRDTSHFIQGNIPDIKPKQTQDNPFIPVNKRQYRVAPDFANFHAFQQPRYTHNKPKVISTNPLTHNIDKSPQTSKDLAVDAAKFFGIDEDQGHNSSLRNLKDYGNMVLGTKKYPFKVI